MAKTPQKEIVAHMLRQAGKRGVHTFEMRQAYIANPSERIAALERAGWVIGHSREVLHGTAAGCRYVKVTEPEFGSVSTAASASGDRSLARDAGLPRSEHQAGADAAVDTEPESLFEVEQPSVSPYDHDRRAA